MGGIGIRTNDTLFQRLHAASWIMKKYRSIGQSDKKRWKNF